MNIHSITTAFTIRKTSLTRRGGERRADVTHQPRSGPPGLRASLCLGIALLGLGLPGTIRAEVTDSWFQTWFPFWNGAPLARNTPVSYS